MKNISIFRAAGSWLQCGMKNISAAVRKTPVRMVALLCLCVFGTLSMYAISTAGDIAAGKSALSSVADNIASYVPMVIKVCYALAGVVAILGGVSIYIKMNNEEQDIKKNIMLVVGSCIFLIAAAQALPAFFGVSSK